jgi:hypothetical protein
LVVEAHTHHARLDSPVQATRSLTEMMCLARLCLAAPLGYQRSTSVGADHIPDQYYLLTAVIEENNTIVIVSRHVHYYCHSWPLTLFAIMSPI